MKTLFGAVAAILILGGCAYKIAAHKHFFESEPAERAKLAADPKNTEAMEALGIIALGQNRTADAKRHFEAALDGRSWLWQTWPFGATLHYRLATVALRNDDFAAASRLFEEAAGKTYDDYAARSRQLALFERRPYRIDGDTATELPVTFDAGRPVVTLRINDGDPARFVIGTGAEEITLDPAFAQRIGAHIAATAEIEIGGREQTVGFGRVDTVRIGTIGVADVPVQTAPQDGVQGILGTRFLMHFRPTFDGPQQRLILRQKTEATPLPKTAKKIPFYLADTHRILAVGAVNDIEGLWAVETDHRDLYVAHASMPTAMADIDWEGKTATIDVATVTLGRGDTLIARQQQGIALKREPALLRGTSGYTVLGALGAAFFRDRVVHFDFDAMEMGVQ